MTALTAQLLEQVRTGNIKFARRLSRSLTVLVLDHHGEELTVLYSSTRKKIVKLLPAGAADTPQYQRIPR